MMASMTATKKSWYRRQLEVDTAKRAARAERRGKLYKTTAKWELEILLELGWKIVSHQQRTYVTGEHWILQKGS